MGVARFMTAAVTNIKVIAGAKQSRVQEPVGGCRCVAMPLVIVISSFVAASRVGGGIAPFILAPLKVDPVHAPTTLLGRHPGWGPPGGGSVSPDLLRGMLQGIEANGLFGVCDAVLTGYFTSEAQIEVAAEAIDRIRATPRQRAHDHAPARPLVVVDPIMGDTDTGRYVADGVAAGLIRHLVPRADLVACNHWEFCEIADCGRGSAAHDLAAAARDTGRDWMVTSVPVEHGIGVLLTEDGASMLATAPFRSGRIPRGAGDLLKLRFIGGRVSGEDARMALAKAVGATHAVINRAILWDAPEMPLAACQDLIADPPEADVIDL